MKMNEKYFLNSLPFDKLRVAPRCALLPSVVWVYNVPEYAKPRRCYQYKLSLSDKPILALQTFNFNKLGSGLGSPLTHIFAPVGRKNITYAGTLCQ
ncbi:TPA: hypothetical protein DCZ32_00820 [Candidatus Uhrbacteria bacterium]|nr:hypothetical protein [Candidatus Uhrbacteria bacterium]